MRLIIFVLTFSALSFVGEKALSQDDVHLPYSLIPQSPDVASLGKYVDQPVSKYTGLPEIKVPIHQIEYGRIKLPIYLSYHAGGVRVDDVASRVGLNWSLQAGGVVSRNVRGKGDFYNVGYSPSEMCSPHPMPDDYFYSFNGYNGRFAFLEESSNVAIEEKPRSITNLELNNLRIKYDLNEDGLNPGLFISNKFIITTPDGLVYTFDTRELVLGKTNGGCGYSFAGQSESWYLSEIYDPMTKRRITFEYDYLGYDLDTKISKRYYTRSASSECECHKQNEDFLNDCTSSSWMYVARILKKITFGDGSITFTANKARLDQPGDFAYTEISIYHKSTVLKSFSLENTFIGTGTNPKARRLVLTGVKELGKNKIDVGKPPYKFEYDNLSALPARGDFQQDLFGFFNGNGATTNEPKIYFYPSLGKDAFSPIPLPNAPESNTPTTGFSKIPNATKMLYGHLRKIIYPTGGEVVFGMEPSEFLYYGNTIKGGGLRLNSKWVYSCTNCEPEITSYSYTLENSTTTSGAINNLPKYAYLCRTDIISMNNSWKQVILRSSENLESTRGTSGSVVGYSRVTETQGNGKIVDTFDNPAIIPDEDPQYSYVLDMCWSSDLFRKYDGYPFYPATSNETLRGKPRKRLIYDKAGNLIGKDSIEYQTSSFSTKEYDCGENIFQFKWGSSGGESDCDFSVMAGIYGKINYKTQFKLPQYTKTTGINNDGTSFVEEKNTSRSVSPSGVLIEEGNSTSNQFGQTSRYLLYHFQYPNTLTGQYAIDNNFLNLVKTSNERRGLNGSATVGVSDETYNYSLNSGKVQLSSFIVNQKGVINKNVQYELYDASGNLTSEIDESGVRTSYKWGYNLVHLVAAAKGVKPNEFAATSFESEATNVAGDINFTVDPNFIVEGNSKSGRKYFTAGPAGGALSIVNLDPSKEYTLSFSAKPSLLSGNITISDLAPVNVSSSSWKSYEVKITGKSTLVFGGTVKYLIDEIRIAPTGTAITTFTYDPLVGLTSITDQNHLTISYEYDELGRLKYIRDNDQNILKRYSYNYIKNQLVEY